MRSPSDSSKKLNPSQWRLSTYQRLALSFAGLIVLGALLLMTPLASVSGESLSFIDAIFTATSAVCVTGLVVVDTGTYFSTFGQVVLILLIQIGGWGIMTVATLAAVLGGKKIQLRERLVLQEATNQLDLSGVVRLTLYIIKATLAIELIGGTLLAIRWFPDYGLRGIYFGYWHAVSSFCNAGFDLLGEYRSLTQYANDFTINLVVSLLIIVGGIGFPVIADLLQYRGIKRLSVHSKIVLLTSAILIILGALFIYASETNNDKTLGMLTPGGQVMASMFQSVSTRTAGYNTIDMSALREGTLLAMIVLMFIGASPSSMGSGIRTTTMAILIIALYASITGRRDPHVFYKKIPQHTIYKAFMITTLSALLILMVTLFLSFTETAPLLQLLFEVTSAFGTVGLTAGITSSLSTAGKLLIALTMFAGRVGTVTLLMAVALRPQRGKILYPEGKIIIG